jgi:dihydroneopterin aldolase
VPQEIRVTVELRFREAPAAAASDDLRETVCYGSIARDLRQACANREFNLIERLADEFAATVRARLRAADAFSSALLAIKVLKVRPPVEGLLGGAAYASGDFLIQ